MTPQPRLALPTPAMLPRPMRVYPFLLFPRVPSCAREYLRQGETPERTARQEAPCRRPLQQLGRCHRRRPPRCNPALASNGAARGFAGGPPRTALMLANASHLCVQRPIGAEGDQGTGGNVAVGPEYLLALLGRHLGDALGQG